MGAGLEEADIVLVGVSRTSKTPLSMYLGYLGYKTANVPVVKGIEPPQELFEIEPAKIVGLTLEASRLAEIRQERLRHMGSRKRQYAELEQIYEELEQADGRSAPARLSRARSLGALDRGDRAPDHPPGQPAARGGRGLLSPAPERSGAAVALGNLVRCACDSGITLFYVLFTPIWLGLRIAGWLADRRARGLKGEP